MTTEERKDLESKLARIEKRLAERQASIPVHTVNKVDISSGFVLLRLQNLNKAGGMRKALFVTVFGVPFSATWRVCST